MHLLEILAVTTLARPLVTAGTLDCQAASKRILPNERVGCRGTFGGITAVECAALGCCFDNSTAGVPWCFAASPHPVLSIVNPNLRWLGFFGQPSSGEGSYVPAVQSGFANFGSSDNFLTIAEGASLRMTSLYKLQTHFVQSLYSPEGHYIGKNLTHDFRARWAELVVQLDPWVANGTIKGFHIGDELCWNGMPWSELDEYASMVASTRWSQVDSSSLIIYYNEAQGPIVRGIDSFKNVSNFKKVPGGITWVSFDYYNPHASVVRGWYEAHLYPKMSSHQRVLLVPGASGSTHRAAPPGWAISDMVSRAFEYFVWAATDQTGYIVGLNPWHWTTVNFTGGFWELGVESIPELRAAYEEIGSAILAAAAAAEGTSMVGHWNGMDVVA